MKLIDKDAVVAEIERRKNENLGCETKAGRGYFSARAMEDIDILSFLDTLEVKGVDLEKEIEVWEDSFKHRPASMEYKETARHFFELGLKAQKGG